MDIIKGLFSKLWEDFSWFILALLGIGILWFWNGGYDNQSAHNGAYIKPLAPLDSGQTYGTYYVGTPTSQKEILNLPEAPANIIRKTENVVEAILAATKSAPPIDHTSLLAGEIFFDGTAGSRSSGPASEYIRIIASEKNPLAIKISGLSLEGVYFDGPLYIPRAGGTTDIYLNPGGRAIISTGISPLGTPYGNVSFRVNTCSTYMSGASKLVPALRNSTFTGSMNYEQCVAIHGNDNNFNSDEWRIFLGQRVELWGNSGDSIKLIDTKGKVIDALQY